MLSLLEGSQTGQEEPKTDLEWMTETYKNFHYKKPEMCWAPRSAVYIIRQQPGDDISSLG